MGDTKAGVSGAAATVIALGTFLVGGLGGLGVGCAVGSVGSSPSASRTQSDGYTAALSSVTAAPTTTTPVVAPLPGDFFISVTVTEQKCFGSAGCIYELNIDPSYIGGGSLAGKWKVVYEIQGGEDPQMGNLTIDGDDIRWDAEKRVDGSAGAEFTAKVTSIVRAY